MKNKGLLVIAGFILVIFIAVGSYCWYTFFLGISSNYGNTSPNQETDKGSITFNDHGGNTYSDAQKLEDDQISNVKPYTFQVENSKKASGRYNILIEDVPLNSVNDGCTSETLLKRNQLKYQLKLNDRVIKEGLLSSIKDNILDTRTIEASKINSYELRIYIYEEAENWTAKHYHYKVTLKEIK